MVYKWYILPIGGLYGTYHLLREPGNSIEDIEVGINPKVGNLTPTILMDFSLSNSALLGLVIPGSSKCVSLMSFSTKKPNKRRNNFTYLEDPGTGSIRPFLNQNYKQVGKTKITSS